VAALAGALAICAGCGSASEPRALPPGGTTTGSVSVTRTTAPPPPTPAPVSPVDAVAARSVCPDGVSVDPFPLDERLGWIEAWYEVVDAPSDLEMSTSRPTFADFSVRIPSDPDVEQITLRVFNSWPMAAPAVGQPDTQVWIGAGRRLGSGPLGALLVFAVDRTDAAFAGECADALNTHMREIFPDDRLGVLGFTTRVGQAAVDYYLAAIEAVQPPPPATPNLPQHDPGLSVMPGLEGATVSRLIRLELTAAPVHEHTIVCAATAAYVGTCAALTAFQEDAITGRWWFELHVLTEPGADVRLVHLPEDSPPNYVELAAVGGADDPDVVQLVVAAEQDDATLVVAE
jgi:hypothetical protein